MSAKSGVSVNLTIRVDSGILLLAQHRALLEGTSVNRQLADALEDYADGMVEAARRSMSAAHVFGVVEEYRRLRRMSHRFRRSLNMSWQPDPAPIVSRFDPEAEEREREADAARPAAADAPSVDRPTYTTD